eukprot:TRINITY_DN3069_c0_g1_i1.p1 TRINITY_DN3069_c0_g1~~TRINITY_DN3069_c0_g1_i1.p1  ORF type:complete len:139 (+),score=9.87 TRINITY_DN3069_c0_g1_i1:27-443(+)
MCIRDRRRVRGDKLLQKVLVHPYYLLANRHLRTWWYYADKKVRHYIHGTPYEAPASVPFLITQDMKSTLSFMGFERNTISYMTPTIAQKIIKEKLHPETSEFARSQIRLAKIQTPGTPEHTRARTKLFLSVLLSPIKK